MLKQRRQHAYMETSQPIIYTYIIYCMYHTLCPVTSPGGSGQKICRHLNTKYNWCRKMSQY